tara:strand:- start:342 stop:2210 length:1869 start_codon:yes stop_codon:yes gene_type:complete
MIISKLKIVDFLIVITLLMLFTTSFLNLKNTEESIFQNDENKETGIELNTTNSCESGKYLFLAENYQELKNYSINYKASDLEVYPEFDNLTCLGKVRYVDIDEQELTIYLGTNRYWFNILNLVINLFLFLLVFGGILLIDKKLYFLYFLINFFNFYLFNSHISLLKIIIPAAEPQSINQNYFINFLFLAFCLIKSRNKNFSIVFIYALVFFIPDYLGIFAIILLMQKENLFQVNSKFQRLSIYFLPVIFYISRTFYSLTSYFDNLWMYSGQRIYHGRSRFYDLVWNYEAMACIKNPDLFINNPVNECRELYGGVLDDYIYITSDPYSTAIITMAIAHICLLIMYFMISKDYPDNKLLLSLLFVSPAVNFLTFQGNLDIVFMIFTFFLFYKQKKLNFITSTIIFVLSLYKVHLIGGLLGLALYGYLNDDKKNGILNLVYLITSSYFAFTLYLEKSIVSNFGRFEESYGLLFIANNLSDLFGINAYLLFSIFIILFIAMYYLNFLTIRTFNNNFYETSSLYEYFLLYWFAFTLLIVNNSYRLPIFLFLIFKLLTSENKVLKNITLIFLFLSVTPVSYLPLNIFFIFIKHLTFFVLTFLTYHLLTKEITRFFKKYTSKADDMIKR